MAIRTPAAAIEQANLILAANDATGAGERHKFPDWLIQDLSNPLAGLQRMVSAASEAEGSRQRAQTVYEDALEAGDDLIRDVNGFLRSLPRSVNRDAMKAHYGIARGVGGHFTNAQVINLLRGFVAANESAPAAAKLRADLLDDIQATIAKIDANRPGASSGERQEEIDDRNRAWELLEDGLSRAWHYLSAALPGGVFDPALARYGFTPRQQPKSGEESETPAPPPTNPV